MNNIFDEREVLEDAADKWWLFLLTGIAWLVFSLLVFQWDYTTVSAISYLFGVVAIVAGSERRSSRSRQPSWSPLQDRFREIVREDSSSAA